MLNSRDIPYVREDRLHNEMRALSEKRNYLMGRMRDSRSDRKEIQKKLLQLEIDTCYVYRELEGRQARKIAHAEYMKAKNKNNSRYRDNRANSSRKVV
jgi:hypothetical protein